MATVIKTDFLELSEILPWEKPVSAEHIRAYYDASYINHGAAMEHALEVLEYCVERGYTLGLVTNGKKKSRTPKLIFSACESTSRLLLYLEKLALRSLILRFIN